MNERNHWITFVNHDVIRWGAFLPPPRGRPEHLIQFGVALVEAGRHHAVWDARRLPGALPFDASTSTFEEYLRHAVHTRQRVPISSTLELPGDTWWTPARLAFYRGDEVVQEEVGDVGALLRQLRPEKTGSFARSTSPVKVMGAAPPVDYDQEVPFIFRLETDIWCPRVVGMHEPLADDEDFPESYDNRALAEIHTPRLNSFLREVRAATLAAGGRWEQLEPDGFGANYADQWDEHGIRL